jgi:hypothetical protein
MNTDNIQEYQKLVGSYIFKKYSKWSSKLPIDVKFFSEITLVIEYGYIFFIKSRATQIDLINMK